MERHGQNVAYMIRYLCDYIFFFWLPDDAVLEGQAFLAIQLQTIMNPSNTSDPFVIPVHLTALLDDR